MRFLITGSSGLIGTALREELKKQDHAITRVVRGKAKRDQVSWDIGRGTIDEPGLEDHDIAVHLAGESIAGIWTAEKKRKIYDSRAKGTRLFANALAGLSRPPRTLISMSGVNIYGARDFAEPVTETSALGTGFLADVSRAWEAGTEGAANAGIRVVNARAAPALSTEGGPLALQLPLFKLGLGAKFGDGEQPWPWIALEDVVHAQIFAAQTVELNGPVNFAAPDGVTNAEATAAIAGALHRPAFLTIPAFALRLAPGGMAEEILLNGSRAVPQKLLDAGYRFRQPELRPALEEMLSSRSGRD